MFHGKKKAVTFSYDDGVTQDRQLIRMLDRYGLKGTFNLNSGLLGNTNSLIRNDWTVAHVKPRACEVERLYRGHEVAGHSLTHPGLPSLDDEEVVRQVEEDRLALSDIVGYEVVGFAYPGGAVDDRIARLIREHTGIRYARTVVSTGNFKPQTELYTFNPTLYHVMEGHGKMAETARRFLESESDEPQLLYVWGHAYEFDFMDAWEEMEAFCRMIAGHDEIFYGTNREVLLETD